MELGCHFCSFLLCIGTCENLICIFHIFVSGQLRYEITRIRMLNINESMWRDSTTTTTMAKTPNAWGTSNDMAIPRRNQFSTANSNNVDPGSNPGPAINTNGVSGPASTGPPVVGVAGVPGGPAGERLKFMFSADEMTESVLFGGPSQKIVGIEDAMDRLNMVKII